MAGEVLLFVRWAFWNP